MYFGVCFFSTHRRPNFAEMEFYMVGKSLRTHTQSARTHKNTQRIAELMRRQTFDLDIESTAGQPASLRARPVNVKHCVKKNDQSEKSGRGHNMRAEVGQQTRKRTAKFHPVPIIKSCGFILLIARAHHQHRVNASSFNFGYLALDLFCCLDCCTCLGL